MWCKYQLSAEGKKYNETLLKPEVLKALYAEIDSVLPSLQYGFAPKKKKQSEGASVLRSAVAYEDPVPLKTPDQLNTHAKTLYEWLDNTKKSAYLLCPCCNNWFDHQVFLDCNVYQCFVCHDSTHFCLDTFMSKKQAERGRLLDIGCFECTTIAAGIKVVVS